MSLLGPGPQASVTAVLTWALVSHLLNRELSVPFSHILFKCALQSDPVLILHNKFQRCTENVLKIRRRLASHKALIKKRKAYFMRLCS